MERRLLFLFLGQGVGHCAVHTRLALTLMYALLCLCCATPVFAAKEDLFKNEQLIKPEVERREIHTERIDTEDLEVGFFVGMYSTEDFGTNPVTGVRLAFHINEDLFIEAAGGTTETEPTSSETFFPTPFPTIRDRTLNYYNVSIGWNILPGESFIGSNWAFSTSYYLIAGAGNTEFADETYFTINAGMGLRFLITDWMAFHMDMRDHIFEHELLLVKKTTHNLEMHTGFTLFF